MTEAISICPIWGGGFEAKGFYIPQTRTFRVEESPRAGGGYEIGEVLVAAQVDRLSYQEKAKLTTWLIDQRLQGNHQPTVTEEVIQHVKNRLSLSVHERAERLLRFIASSAETVADSVALSSETNKSYACAWSESTNLDEVDYFVNYLDGNGWIRGIRTLGGWQNATVTVDGYSRIAEQEANQDSSQVFVAMWFDKSMDKAFTDGITPAIEEAGYRPLRIDHKPDVNKIDDEIIAEIRRSRFLVADFTQGDNGARGGVYFEAGFALGLGLRVVYTCRKDEVDKLAFDTRQYSHILWEKPEDLREALANRIVALIGEGPKTS